MSELIYHFHSEVAQRLSLTGLTCNSISKENVLILLNIFDNIIDVMPPLATTFTGPDSRLLVSRTSANKSVAI